MKGVEGITLNDEAPGTKNAYWMVTAIIAPHVGLTKDCLMERMSANNIDTRPFFHPLSSLPAYADQEQARQARDRNRVSYEISPYGINLPSGLNLTEAMVDRVCDALREALTP